MASPPHLALDAQNEALHRHLLSRHLQRLPDEGLQVRAAGNLHLQNGDILDLVGGEDRGQLLDEALPLVELGAADEGDPPLDEVSVDGGRCEGGAVGGDQKARAVEVRGVCMGEPHLDRPVGELRLCGDGGSFCLVLDTGRRACGTPPPSGKLRGAEPSCARPSQRHRAAPLGSAVQLVSGLVSQLRRFDGRLDGDFVELLGLPLLDR